jgi:uncharacterized membrane protein YfcA
MRLPLKVSSATSNFMIGVSAGAGAFVFLARGDVSTAVATPVAWCNRWLTGKPPDRASNRR